MKKRDPERVWIDSKDCERMTRKELLALEWTIAAQSVLLNTEEDLQKRLEMIPEGARRLSEAVKGLKDVVEDVVGTITVEQAKRIKGTMTDYELRILPKAMPPKICIFITKEQGMELVDSAKERCKACTLDGDEAQKGCKLYKILEAVVPLDDYGDGILCPYNMLDWAD